MDHGLKYGRDENQNKVNEVAVELLTEFETINGTTICRDLINHDLALILRNYD